MRIPTYCVPRRRSLPGSSGQSLGLPSLSSAAGDCTAGVPTSTRVSYDVIGVLDERKSHLSLRDRTTRSKIGTNVPSLTDFHEFLDILRSCLCGCVSGDERFEDWD